MRMLIWAGALLAAMATSAVAERYVMITHTQGTDPFWPVVEKAGRDAAEDVGAEFEYNFDPSGDMAGMAKLIEAATATQPDGIVVSLPDADALGGAIRSAVDSGIPVITMNSGLEASKDVGALMHVGQPERDAGAAAGARAMAEGVTKGLCLNQEAFNTALVDRAQDIHAMGRTNQIDVPIVALRPKRLHSADPQSTGCVGPHVSVAAASPSNIGGADCISCFDLP